MVLFQLIDRGVDLSQPFGGNEVGFARNGAGRQALCRCMIILFDEGFAHLDAREAVILKSRFDSRSLPPLGGPPVLKTTEDGEQDDSANRRYENRGEIEPFRVLEAKETADQKAADQRADDPDDEIGQQAVIATGNAFGQPASEQTDNDAGYDVHGCRLFEFRN